MDIWVSRFGDRSYSRLDASLRKFKVNSISTLNSEALRILAGRIWLSGEDYRLRYSLS